MSVSREPNPNLRSRKPKMVPYVKCTSNSQSGIAIDDGLGSMSTLLVSKDEDHRQKEQKWKERNRADIPDGRSVNGDVTSSSGNYVVDGSGGFGMVEASGSGEGNGECVSTIIEEYEETSFINRETDRETDMEPLLSKDDSSEDGDPIIVLKDSTETSLSICLQVTLPYIIAGFGMVLAGMVLDIVQHWPVFTEVTEIFVLVPALLGLKGNLEMTLASRLSTQANLGNMNTKAEKWKMIGGNMALVQAQANIVGFLASIVAMVMGWIPDGKFNLHHALLLCASSMCTAALASFALGCVMVGVVLLSKKCKINPDNVATPIAASLGDLITLSLLAGVACLLYKSINTQVWLAPVIIVLFLLLTPLWIYISVKNHYTSDVVYSGWTPVISAMAISSVGGLILDYTVTNYNGIAVFQPVINGVGGNLVAVQASRISTSLHQATRPGTLPTNAIHGCPNCPSAFFGSNVNSRATRVLLALVIPGHLIFMYTISFMKAGHTSITIIFSIMYLTAALLQVAILLYIANWMVHYIWRKGDDPDNVAIPYLTALGDLLGTGFLAIAFHILFLIGDRDADLGD